MSKKSNSDTDPNTALIMRTLTHINAKFDKLPTVEHLQKLESDLHAKLEANTNALKNELRTEFRGEIQEQVNKMTDMIAEVRSQVQENPNPAGRNNNQMGRYLRARRSFKVWPIEVEGPGEAKAEQAVRKFFNRAMAVPVQVASSVLIDNIRPADQARNSKITKEYVVAFADVEARDAIKSYASGLAAMKGEAGLRLDIPPCLKGSFKILNEHGLSMVRIYGKEVKRNIRFDDRNSDLMMDIKLPTSSTWHNITIEQAREARKARDLLDIKNIRQAALGSSAATNASAVDRDKARALMLSFSPQGRSNDPPSNFQSTTGVVHINSSQDWRNFESETAQDESMDRSIEEILGARSTRGGGARRKTSAREESRDRS